MPIDSIFSVLLHPPPPASAINNPAASGRGIKLWHADGFCFALPILPFFAASSGELNPKRLNRVLYGF